MSECKIGDKVLSEGWISQTSWQRGLERSTRREFSPLSQLPRAGGKATILSFAWTTDVLLAGKKTCTRRRWIVRTASSWLNAYHQGRYLHQAWNNTPFVKGAKKIADIRLTQLYQECLADMLESDVETEGGLWPSKEEFINLFGSSNTLVWVVRFQLLSQCYTKKILPSS